jgi:hypothetical protein
VSERSDDGWLVDDAGIEWGYCNACGEEAEAGTECCEAGEVVPYEGDEP